jgi:hypothetical protein
MTLKIKHRTLQYKYIKMYFFGTNESLKKHLTGRLLTGQLYYVQAAIPQLTFMKV